MYYGFHYKVVFITVFSDVTEFLLQPSFINSIEYYYN
jgi:hypothetical protein